jgi:SPX domain protein involved in polyphosphate accumulation
MDDLQEQAREIAEWRKMDKNSVLWEWEFVPKEQMMMMPFPLASISARTGLRTVVGSRAHWTRGQPILLGTSCILVA